MSRSTADNPSRKALGPFVSLALLSTLFAPGVFATASEGEGSGRIAPAMAPLMAPVEETAVETGRLLVRFREGVSHEVGAASVKQSGARNPRRSSSTGWIATEVDAGTDIDTLLETIARNPAVQAVEIEHRVFPALSTNDPLRGQQWALDDILGGHDIVAQEGWDIIAERAPVGSAIVAVIDSGVDRDHPDLVDNLWLNAGEVPANGIDDDDNGYIDDVSGWDFYEGDADPADVYGHGTHVAGIIAARTDNATGMAGVAGPLNPVRVMPIEIFDGFSGGSTLDAAEALRYAVDNGASVINVSWGGSSPDAVLVEAVEYAEDNGVMLVCAAGNTSTSNETIPFYPASFANDNVIAVAATSSTGGFAPYSNRGAVSVDLAAPGSDILSTYLNGGFVRMSGTSMAAPHVSAAAALVGLRFPSEWWGSHRLRIIEHSRMEPALEGLVASSRALDLESVLATAAPGGSMVVAARASRVNTTTVSVSSDVWGATQMEIDEDGNGVYAAPQSFDPLIEITLPSGDGTKTLSVRYSGEIGPQLELTRNLVLDTTAPTTPTGFVATPRNRGAYLTWSASASDDVTGYIVWGAPDAGGPFQRVEPDPLPGTTYTALGLDNGATYHFKVSAVDTAGNEGARTAAVAVTPEFAVDRVQGPDRYSTAVALSAKSFDAADAVVLTTGQAFPDAVVASSLAGALDAPLLFARADSLPQATADEIVRLGASRVVIIGGTNAVSDEVAEALDMLTGVAAVERIAGTSRYETSALVARAVHAEMGAEFPDRAFVVRGDAFPDAVSVASAAYAEGMPVLLVQPTMAPWDTAQAIADTGVTRLFVAGGTNAVSNGVMEALGLPFTRAQGTTRYETSVAVAELGLSRGWSDDTYIGMASGVQFVDALSGGAALGAKRGVVVLTRPDSVPPEVAWFTEEHASGVAALWLLGGERAIGPEVLADLEAIVR